MSPLSGGERMHVFRTGRRRLNAARLVDGLARELRAAVTLGPASQRGLIVGALVRAGELECALEDTGAEEAIPLGAVTDLVADVLVDPHRGERAGGLNRAATLLAAVQSRQMVTVAPHEGFTYYGLHPLDYATLVEQAPTRARTAAVVGVRSIGVTLAAVVAAALRRRGVMADRISVRPEGHPYRRRVLLQRQQCLWIERHVRAGSDFLIADEGPGTSGSSFLATAEALVAAGVPGDRITLLCSRHEDPERLVAPRAAERWRAFTAVAPPDYRQPPQAATWIGAGAWRRLFWSDETIWPASWLALERRKFLSADGRRLYKFEGMGRTGREVQERAAVLAATGFAPRPSAWDHAHGYAEYPMLAAQPLTLADLSPEVLERIGEYIAARSIELPAPAVDSTEIEEMLRFDALEELGIELPAWVTLETVRPVIADARMMPHEWLRERRGDLFKTDAVTHGDDHLFPGPVDIAWDLAGAIVEWQLDGAAQGLLLERYRRLSGDDPRPRLPAYLFSYALFRAACARMAACTMIGTEEKPRLAADYARYRTAMLCYVTGTSLEAAAATL